ncbi:LSB1 (YGR136W) and PIN3 (YPR154W) [Zygosaccharomyces parabailii]|uniref:BN860_06722g1_1 n=1 Tax=Zygosaccharomyces bailii (strain CLIB 213 / ATCC 58445 / CBS 680 / BCRC 21525 / NBRC 1098 / NCYC 1416 / NRRL Y-2227) TaxID=1333698 RepID=A0A8J2X836_ZYGB2|nr:LSB1 (YGR136W) and PIN3 (YPR154W) [Zygosaccharomyces parabailii]CDF87453.1 BN860_06722g1_1 [Zygosaccharomyces bailii CLIB 213]CDH09400.1 related to [PSI+] inducibility protein 3 [Zygosaccharomyces bailii ISA1307]
MSAKEINTSLHTIKSELDFLLSKEVIDKDTYEMVWGHLHQHEQSANEYVEAIYRFDPQQEGDLQLNPGDKIEVLEKCSPEWFKGRCNGQVGMFPSNYVKPAFSGEAGFSRPAAPPPPQYSEKATGGAPVQYAQPSGGSYQQPLPYPPPSTGYYQQPMPQQQAQPMVVQQEQHRHHSGLSKFGGKLGNAAIFGAGATLGSDLVNSIF